MTPLRETRCPQKFHSRVIRFQRMPPLYQPRNFTIARVPVERTEHGRVLIGGASFSFQKSSSWKASFLCHLVPRTTPSRVTQHESPPRCSVSYTYSNRIHIWNKRMHRVEAVQRNRANVCVNERRVEGAESRMPVFPGPRIGTGYLVWFYSIFQLINNIFSFAFCDCFWFLSILNLFSKKLKREFQFYNYGSSDVNTDFVNGGHNIVARVFVLRNFFLIV